AARNAAAKAPAAFRRRAKGVSNLCGIAGFTHKNWAPEPERIEKATATLAHRGPDQSGVYRSSVLSMGATRLKIIDLEGGNQPIISDDGDSAIVFNGEIYNHLELRGELEKLGHRFHSHSDTETVLHAFVEWDTQCFSRLRCGKNRRGGWFWRATGWGSSRFISRGMGKIYFSGRN